MSSVVTTKKSFLQSVKETVSSMARSVGGFLGRITASIKSAALWTLGKGLTGVYYLTKVPVVGKFVSYLPVSALGMGVATLAMGVIEAFEIGLVPTAGLFIMGIGPLGWALLVGTVELAILITLLDTSIRIMAWCLLPAFSKAAEMEA